MGASRAEIMAGLRVEWPDGLRSRCVPISRVSRRMSLRWPRHSEKWEVSRQRTARPIVRRRKNREASLQYVRYGSSGIKVSRLCFGCMSFGDPAWHEWVLDDKASRPFFKAALEKGINYFDTADLYSHGESEAVTGRALKEMARRDEVVIATKVCRPMGPGPEPAGPVAQAHHGIDRCVAEAAADRLCRPLCDPSATTTAPAWKRRWRRCMTWSRRARRSISGRHRCGPGSSPRC